MQGMKISPEQAAPVLCISPNGIRYYMRTNQFNPPIGRVRVVNNGTGTKKKYRYDIYKNMVMDYMNLKEWPEEEK